MEDKQQYKFCSKCGTSTKAFTWVKHFSNAYFWGCPVCNVKADKKHN